MSRQDQLDIARALNWTGGAIDRETGEWAHQLAEDLARWVAKRPHTKPRADLITKAIAPYLGLPRVMDTIERVTGARFH